MLPFNRIYKIKTHETFSEGVELVLDNDRKIRHTYI